MIKMNNKRKHESEGDSEDEVDVSLNKSQEGYMSDEEGGIRIGDIYIPPPPRAIENTDNKGTRLMITKISNTNFKSYGGTKILGPFHKCFNAIVGPNGSGKSNVIDSLLFVFGYRASKIRSKKLSVLLHNSAKYPNVNSCSVSIYFTLIKDKENSDNYEEIPNSEFVVSRTALRDNSSFYQLNGKRVQYKDIAILLRKHGIDLDHNRFLILQGEVEQISLMKPKAQNEHDTGMLEYLEDIIGTARYKEPLCKLEEQIEMLATERLEKINRVKMAENERDLLKEPMTEAVKFLELENDITRNRNALYQKHLKEIGKTLSENQAEMNRLTEEHKTVEDQLSSLSTEKKCREEDFQQKNEKYDCLNKKKEKLTEAFDAANTRDISIQEDSVQTNKRRKKIIEQLKIENSKLEGYEKLPEQNLQKIEEYERRATQLEEQQDTLQTEKNKLLSSLREETIELQEQKEQLQTKQIDLRKIVGETKSALTLAESELKLYMTNEENESNKIEILKKTFEDNKSTLTERTKILKELKHKIPLTEKSLKEAQKDLEQVKCEEANLIQEIKTKRVQVEESRSSFQASKSRGRVLDALIQQKTEGNLPGLFGRLGDLGAIDQKYDVAVSTACGPLDNIVVDTVDTAQWCIEFLKVNDIGRATFIALDKQEHLRNQANTPLNIPENCHRLFDLIKIDDERVKTAFYYALRDTLVANDLNQASIIAYGATRFRVVTLKGELIEISGTMSGGGKVILKGRMGQSVTTQTKTMSPEKITDMETALIDLEAKTRELHKTQQELEDQVTTLQNQLRSMKINVEKFTIEVQSLQQQQPALSDQLKKQEQKAKSCCTNPQIVKQMQNQVESHNKEYEKALAKSEELQKQVDVVISNIKFKTDRKMTGINKKITECSQTLEKCKAEIIILRVAIKTADRNTKKSKEKIINFENEKLSVEKKLIKMQEERKQIEKDAAVLLQSIEKIATELTGNEETFTEEQKIISKLTKKINKVKAEQIELDQKLHNVNKTLKENHKELQHYESKLGQLCLQEIPEQIIEELTKHTDLELDNIDPRHMTSELKTLEDKLKTLKPNLNAIKEYKQKELNYLQRAKELEKITERRNFVKDKRDEVRKKRQTEFFHGFNTISSKLKEMYQMITLGGDADLELVDTYDPFTEGIVLNVRPPKKSWKNITNLSGGEKTLSSLALVFALHYYKPSPLYFMDEIDAALDFKNVSIVGNYIKERTKNAQFIIISLRSNMFELANHLIGIYKTNNITKSTTIRLNCFILNDSLPAENGNIVPVENDLSNNINEDIIPIVNGNVIYENCNEVHKENRHISCEENIVIELNSSNEKDNACKDKSFLTTNAEESSHIHSNTEKMDWDATK